MAENRRGSAIDTREISAFVSGVQAQQSQANRDLAKTVVAGVLSAALFRAIRRGR